MYLLPSPYVINDTCQTIQQDTEKHSPTMFVMFAIKIALHAVTHDWWWEWKQTFIGEKEKKKYLLLRMPPFTFPFNHFDEWV